MPNNEPQAGGVEPHLAQHGKVSYIEIPARDPITSGVFYEAVFGWRLSPPTEERVSYELGPRDNQRVPFVDVAGGLLGAFVAGRGASSDGVVLYIYTNDIDAVLGEAEARGCEVVEAVRPEGDLRVARFRDPGGNIMGIWQAGSA